VELGERQRAGRRGRRMINVMFSLSPKTPINYPKPLNPLCVACNSWRRLTYMLPLLHPHHNSKRIPRLEQRKHRTRRKSREINGRDQQGGVKTVRPLLLQLSMAQRKDKCCKAGRRKPKRMHSSCNQRRKSIEGERRRRE
jgi:hypothetical protein